MRKMERATRRSDIYIYIYILRAIDEKRKAKAEKRTRERWV